MGIGYCMKCREKREIIKGELFYFKNGTPAEKGECKECGCGMSRMYGKAERAALKGNPSRGEAGGNDGTTQS